MTRTQMALAGAAALCLLALRGCYEIRGAGAGTFVYRLNRLTGAVAVCHPSYGCHALEEGSPYKATDPDKQP